MQFSNLQSPIAVSSARTKRTQEKVQDVLDLIPYRGVDNLNLDVTEGLSPRHLYVLVHEVHVDDLIGKPALAEPGAAEKSRRKSQPG